MSARARDPDGMGSVPFLDAPLRQAAALEHVEHRPWPPPARGWTIGMTWEDLVFAHWRVPAELLRPRLPAGLELEEADGSAWVGVVPFRLTGLRLRGLLPVPGASSFLELNVRTYVSAGGKRGLWFFSLDASSAWAVEVARRTYHLPYFRARLSVASRSGGLHYECVRAGEPGRAFSATFRPEGDPFRPAPGSLEAFLTERYCLYAVDGGGRLCRAEVHHAPWELRPAEARVELDTMPPFELPGEGPLCHAAGRLDVLVWPLEPVAGGRAL